MRIDIRAASLFIALVLFSNAAIAQQIPTPAEIQQLREQYIKYQSKEINYQLAQELFMPGHLSAFLEVGIRYEDGEEKWTYPKESVDMSVADWATAGWKVELRKHQGSSGYPGDIDLVVSIPDNGQK